MRYVWDNDLHLHSKISLCSNDPEQTNERILQYAEENGLKTICVTDHFWDASVDGASAWYMRQDYDHIAAAKPLPQSEKVRFLFGCETELNCSLTLGISKETCDKFDFIVVPTTHFQMKGFTLTDEEARDAQSRAKAWVKRLNAVLDMDLPFHKIGIAHLTCGLIASTKEMYFDIIENIPTEEMERAFSKAAQLGAGIELNASNMNFRDDEAEILLRPFRVAKRCGCKFYCASDAHHPKDFNVKAIFERVIDLLELTEDDKFRIGGI